MRLQGEACRAAQKRVRHCRARPRRQCLGQLLSSNSPNLLKVLAADVRQTRSSEPILHGLKRLLIVRATIEVHLSVRPIGLGW